MNLVKFQDVKSVYRSHYIKAMNYPKKDIKEKNTSLNIKNKMLCYAVLSRLVVSDSL